MVPVCFVFEISYSIFKRKIIGAPPTLELYYDGFPLKEKLLVHFTTALVLYL